MAVFVKTKRKRTKKEPVTEETTKALKEQVTQALKETLKLTDVEIAKVDKDELPDVSVTKRHNRYAYSLRTMKDVDVNEHNYRLIHKNLTSINKDVEKYLKSTKAN